MDNVDFLCKTGLTVFTNMFINYFDWLGCFCKGYFRSHILLIYVSRFHKTGHMNKEEKPFFILFKFLKTDKNIVW